MPVLIKKIRMREYKSDRFSIYMDAEVDDNGNLYVSTEYVGEEAGYEFENSLRVKKGDKEAALLALVEEQLKDRAGAMKWMEANGLPLLPHYLEHLNSLLETQKEYEDTILLLLLKERFPTLSDFRSWLETKGVPSLFHSES